MNSVNSIQPCFQIFLKIIHHQPQFYDAKIMKMPFGGHNYQNILRILKFKKQLRF